MPAVSAQTAEHYAWGDGCDGWHLVRRDDLSVIQERMPPHTSEVAHYHARSQQFFFVPSGVLSILLDGVHYRLAAEDGLAVPPGVVHRVFNDSDAEARFLVISAPPAHGDRFAVG